MGNQQCQNGTVGDDLSIGLGFCGGKKRLRAMTWNVAGLTPNVFEFWGQAPNAILEAAEEYLTRPEDTPLAAVLTDARLADLQKYFQMLEWPAIPDHTAHRLRKTGLVAFLSDDTIGKKRLVSLPDRTTAGLGMGRPGATTPYGGCLNTLDDWWSAWLTFMFTDGAHQKVKPHPKKYHGALSEDEIALSQPLQVLYLALFDGALIHVLNEASPGWMETKARLLTSNREALRATICASYGDCAIIFLQEASTVLRETLEACLPNFRVLGGARGQDSLVLLNKARVTEIEDVTQNVVQDLTHVEPGDAVCVNCLVDGEKMLLASFHADSEGKSTIGFMEAITAYAGPNAVCVPSLGPVQAHATPCLLGLDANCDARPDTGAPGRATSRDADKLTIVQFREATARNGLQTCFGDEEVWTTFKARTFIQPQFQKAVLRKDLHVKADRSPKDHILASQGLSFALVQRDTTGAHKFLDAPLPSEGFPSDHAIIAAELVF